MIFLGLAANYSGSGALRHLFALGSEQSSEDLRQYLAAKHSSEDYTVTSNRVALYHNGRSALMVAIRNLVPAGSEVIVNGFTCQAVVQAVKAAKCKPVYADITPETLHFNAATLRACLRRHPEARALIVQNTLGYPVDMVEIEAVARSRKLVIIEDLAHGVSQHYPDGRAVGTVGAAVALSFGKGKAIDTISGGAVVMRQGEKLPAQPLENPRLGDRLRDRLYPLFGLTTRALYHVGGIGKYFMSFLVKTHLVQRSADAEADPGVRLPNWQAKLALTQLKMLEVMPEIAELPLRRFYLVDDREDVLDRLERAKCYLREFWYETPIAPKRYYARQKFPEAECPVAVAVAQRILNLPCYYSAEQLKPALAIIHGEDPRAEERAKRAAKVAARAAKMEAKAEKIKSGGELTLEKESARKAESSQAAAKVEKSAAGETAKSDQKKKKAHKNRHDRKNAKIEAARLAEEGGEAAGFRTVDLDFMELEKSTEEEASLPARRISNKSPEKITKKAPASRPAAKKPTKTQPRSSTKLSGRRQVLKSAPPEAPQPVTRASAVLKTKQPEAPKVNARKNEFFERKGGSA